MMISMAVARGRAADDRTVLLPEGTSNIDMSSKVQLLQAEVNNILARYTEIVLFE